MKKTFLLLAMVIYLMALPNQIHANPQKITVIINGETQQYDQPPVLESGRTLVPLRGIFETLGAKVKWNQNEGKVTASRGDKTIELTIGSKKAKINEQLHNLDVAVKTINNRTVVPLRFIGEALGEAVQWEQATRTVYIGDRLEHNPDTASDVVAKVKDIYEDAGAEMSFDGENYFAGGNGINQSYANNTLFVFNMGNSINFTVAAQAANELGGSGDVSKIAAAIEKVFSGTADGPIQVGNITVSSGGRTVTLTWNTTTEP